MKTSHLSVLDGQSDAIRMYYRLLWQCFQLASIIFSRSFRCRLVISN